MMRCGTHRSSTEDLAGTPWLDRWECDLWGQVGGRVAGRGDGGGDGERRRGLLGVGDGGHELGSEKRSAQESCPAHPRTEGGKQRREGHSPLRFIYHALCSTLQGCLSRYLMRGQSPGLF